MRLGAVRSTLTAHRPAAVAAPVEPLEGRVFLSAAAGAVLRPDHVVIVVGQDRLSNAIGDRAHLPYLNALADAGLVYTDAHGVTHPSQPNLLALYSGSTQGVTSNAQGYSFPTAPNLAKSLFDAGLSFAGFSETLPFDGSQAQWYPGEGAGITYPDQYVRFLNPMAMFGDVGTDPATGRPRANAVVNRTFNAFKAIGADGSYDDLPTVSFVFPNNLHSGHGSNNAYPYGGSGDPDNNNLLRTWADDWLRDNLGGYADWAKTHNSLLVVTQDEEQYTGASADTVTTVVAGDPRLVVAGANANRVDHYALLRTVSDMYGLAPLGQAANVAGLDANAAGQLAPTGAVRAATNTALAGPPAASTFGQPVTFTATVTAAGGGGGDVPTGPVTFWDGPAAIGTAPLDGSGVAALTVASLGGGTHSVTAAYAGDAEFRPSASAAVAHAVAKAATTSAVTSSANPQAAGLNVTFTATVTAAAGAGTATGTVTFYDGTTSLGSRTLDATGRATLTTAALAAGSHAVTAAYAGDASRAGSTSAALAQTVTAAPARPPNDAFANRVFLTGSAVAATGSNLNGTKEAGEPAHAGNAGGKSVWWSWTAPAAGTVTIDTLGSSFDTLLAVYTGTVVNALTKVTNGSNDDSPAGNTQTSRVTFAAAANTTYKVAVDGYAGATGAISLQLAFSGSPPAAPTGVSATDGTDSDKVRVTWAASTGAIGYEVWRATTNSTAAATLITAADVAGTPRYDDATAAPGTTYWYWVKAKNAAGTSGFSAGNSGYRAASAPANNAFANRVTLTGATVTTTGTNVGATKEAGEPTHAGNAGGKSVWWSWTAPAAGTATIDTLGSSFDTLLAVYTGTAVNALTKVTNGSNDDSPAGNTQTSRVTFAVTAGTAYQIAVDGFDGLVGTISLKIKLV